LAALRDGRTAVRDKFQIRMGITLALALDAQTIVSRLPRAVDTPAVE